MSKRNTRKGGYLDELQTQQERELQTYQPPKQEDIYVSLDDDDSESDEAEKQLVIIPGQNNINYLKKLPKFLEGNQITLDNAFKLKIPEQIHLKDCESLVKSSIYLSSLATLYGIRVDSTLRDSYKVKCGILRIHGATTYDDNNDIFEQVQAREKQIEKTHNMAKKRITQYGTASIERNDKNIEVKAYDTVQINPFFHLTSKKLDLQKMSSMLLYKPQYSQDLSIIIDPEQLKPVEKLQERLQPVKIEFSFQPPQPLNYEKYFTNDIIEIEQEGTFKSITDFKNLIDEECKKKNLQISTRKFISLTRAKTETKSSDIDFQTQFEWNQEMDYQQYQESIPHFEQQYDNNELQHLIVSSINSKAEEDRNKQEIPDQKSVQKSLNKGGIQPDQNSQSNLVNYQTQQEINIMHDRLQGEQIMELEHQSFIQDIDYQQEQEWNFVNQYYDENQEPLTNEDVVITRRRDTRQSFDRNHSFEAYYRNSAEQLPQKQQPKIIESSSNNDSDDDGDLLDADKIKFMPAMTQVINLNQKNTSKIKDLIQETIQDKNDEIFTLHPQLAPQSKSNKLQRKPALQSSLQWDFNDCLDYNRTILQVRRNTSTKKLTADIQTYKYTEYQFYPPNLARYFEFSLREVFTQSKQKNQEVLEENQETPQDVEFYQDEEIFQFSEIQQVFQIDEVNQDLPYSNPMDPVEIQNMVQAVEYKLNIRESSSKSRDNQMEEVQNDIPRKLEIKEPGFIPQPITKEEGKLKQIEEEQQIYIEKLPITIQKQEIIKQEHQIQFIKKLRRPYRVGFIVNLPPQKEHTQIPVKLLKQCVQKIIAQLIQEKQTIIFSRIWLTIPLILPTVHKLITLSQLYIAVLFLANEEKLILQREGEDINKETDFLIVKQK